jgi:hypothetical protein
MEDFSLVHRATQNQPTDFNIVYVCDKIFLIPASVFHGIVPCDAPFIFLFFIQQDYIYH